MKFELVHDANVCLAETPIWDKRNNCLYWTDMFEGEIFEYNPASGAERKWSAGKLIGSAVPSENPGELFAALADGMYRLDKATGALSLIACPEPGNAKNRYNDTRIDSEGRIYTSSVANTYATPDYSPDQTGAFYQIERDGTVKKLLDGINQFNCMVWNNGNTKMWVADTYNMRLLEWDYDPGRGAVGVCRTALDFNGKQGTPDGMCLDVEGNLYICHWTGKISVWDKNLSWKEDIPFPVEQVCACGFGGGDMKDFYVTTARYGYTPEQLRDRRGAGGIFAARSPVAGRPDYFFK
ncbi:MAG: SMP-30/gluconolactonase/LRE family protein [Treponema sp.]|jgi:sugar lactone lactonase YvrE|nr:SMP-30/gluconolactonase/LRE family protein [Treponema sp.]